MDRQFGKLKEEENGDIYIPVYLPTSLPLSL